MLAMNIIRMLCHIRPVNYYLFVACSYSSTTGLFGLWPQLFNSMPYQSWYSGISIWVAIRTVACMVLLAIAVYSAYRCFKNINDPISQEDTELFYKSLKRRSGMDD